MKQLLHYVSICLLATLFFSACEKVNLEEDGQAATDEANLILHLVTPKPTFSAQSTLEKNNSTSTELINIAKVCSRIDCALFKGSKKMKRITQTTTEKHFGQLAMSVSEGKYTVVIIAHNGEGAATISSPQKIKFPHNKVTDTYSFCGEVTVEEKTEKTLTLLQTVAVVSLHITEKLPVEATQIELKYTGGSSTLDAKNGVGCVKSRQTETREITDKMHTSPSQIKIYTFPRTDQSVLMLTATVLNKADHIMTTKEFTDIEVQTGSTSILTSRLFPDFIDADAPPFTLL